MIMALLSITLITYLASRLTSQAMGLLHVSHEITAGGRFRNVIRGNLAPLPPGSGRRCIRRVISGSEGAQAWHLCSIEDTHLRQEPSGTAHSESFDWNHLFLTASSCFTGRTPTSQRAFTSPVAAHDCAIPGAVNGDLTVLDNLRGDVATISAPGSAPQVLIATPGELTIKTSVTLSSDALIVAGGDLAVSLISNSSSRAIHITLISAHGNISVEQLAGNVALRAFGRAAISIPKSLVGSRFPSLATRLPSLSGISPSLE